MRSAGTIAGSAFLWFGPAPRVSDLRCSPSPCSTAARLEICAGGLSRGKAGDLASNRLTGATGEIYQICQNTIGSPMPCRFRSRMEHSNEVLQCRKPPYLPISRWLTKSLML